MAGPLDLAGGDDAHAVGVEQQHRHHSRVKPFLPTGILGLCRTQDLREIQLIDQIEKEVHLVVIREPVTRRWRQQGRLLGVPGSESLGHEPILTSRSVAATAI